MYREENFYVLLTRVSFMDAGIRCLIAYRGLIYVYRWFIDFIADYFYCSFCIDG